MPVPNTIADLNQAAASNFPLGTDTVGPSLDDYLRAGFSFTRQLFDGTPWLLGSIAGTADAITATCPVPFTAYVAGQSFKFMPTANNTTNAVTININGIGTKSITKNGTQALAPGDLVAGVAVVLFYDGTQHQLLTAPGTQIGAANSSVRSLVAQNGASPNTQMGMSAASVTFRGASGQTPVTRFNVATTTNDISAAGPVANGRDQVAAFGATSTVHFYYIWNGASIATLSSLQPPTAGPTMPTGYTHWAYALTVILNGTNLHLIRAYGRRVHYVTPPSLGTPNVSATGTYSTFVPQIAESWSWRGSISITADGATTNAYASLGIDSGLTNQPVAQIGASGVVGSIGPVHGRWTDLPNVPGQVITYNISVPFGNTQATTNFVTDYVVPNC